MGTIVACTAFGAVCGSTTATAATIVHCNPRDEALRIWKQNLCRFSCRWLRAWDLDAAKCGVYYIWHSHPGIHRKIISGRHYSSNFDNYSILHCHLLLLHPIPFPIPQGRKISHKRKNKINKRCLGNHAYIFPSYGRDVFLDSSHQPGLGLWDHFYF